MHHKKDIVPNIFEKEQGLLVAQGCSIFMPFDAYLKNKCIFGIEQFVALLNTSGFNIVKHIERQQSAKSYCQTNMQLKSITS